MLGIFRRPERGYERGHENRLLAWIPPSEVAPRVPVPLTLSDKGVAAGILCISDVVLVAGNGVSSFAKYVCYYRRDTTFFDREY